MEEIRKPLQIAKKIYIYQSATAVHSVVVSKKDPITGEEKSGSKRKHGED